MNPSRQRYVWLAKMHQKTRALAVQVFGPVRLRGRYGEEEQQLRLRTRDGQEVWRKSGPMHPRAWIQLHRELRDWLSTDDAQEAAKTYRQRCLLQFA